jgi:MFS family permease
VTWVASPPSPAPVPCVPVDTVLGAGFGTYWAAAPAVLTAVLPAASDRAKDLGVINVGYSLPLVVAPIIAGVVLGLMHNYPSLFALAGLASLAAGATITRVRSVP